MRAADLPPSQRKRKVVFDRMRTRRRNAPRPSVVSDATCFHSLPDLRSIVTVVPPPVLQLEAAEEAAAEEEGAEGAAPEGEEGPATPEGGDAGGGEGGQGEGGEG